MFLSKNIDNFDIDQQCHNIVYLNHKNDITETSWD